MSKNRLHILMITVELPSAKQPNTMAPVARQIQSLRAIGVTVDVIEVKGHPKMKYIHALPAIWARAPFVDIVHGHYAYCGWLARCQFQKPVIVSFMGSDIYGTTDAKGTVTFESNVIAKIDRQLAYLVDAVIVKSPEMAKIVAPVNAYVVPNGVDIETFHPMDKTEARSILGWEKKKRYILFPGNPENLRKGYPIAQSLVEQASIKMQEPLTLIPMKHVPSNQVPFYMNACDAMLMTSFLEGSPNVVKEALACNTPIVSVPVGDVADLLEGVEGCVVAPRNIDTLSTALVNILNRNQPSQGRKRILEKDLDVASVARKLVTIYECILAETEKNQPRKRVSLR